MEIINFIIDFGNKAGWASNILGLLVVPSTLFVTYRKRAVIMEFFKRHKYNNIEDYVDQNIAKFSDAQSLKIAIIDDEPDEFPVAYIRQRGHQVIEYNALSLADWSSLLIHDIVFLDMIGVIKEDATRGALELIKKLKSAPVSPYVIAVSKATFDPTVTDYFKQADDVEKKPITEIKCDQLIDLYERDVSPKYCSRKIDSFLNEKAIPRKITEKATGMIIDLLDDKIEKTAFVQKFSILPANIDKHSTLRFIDNLLRAKK